MKTMSYYYYLVRMAKSPNTDNINAGENMKQHGLIPGGGCKMVQLFWKTLWQLLTKLNILLSHKSRNYGPWYLPKEENMVTQMPAHVC